MKSRMQAKFWGAIAATFLTLGVGLPAWAEMGTLLGSPGSRINVRSQPSTSASAPHYGIPGDRVTILDQRRMEDNYTWFYVEFPRSRARGWIRGDLIRPDSTSSGNTSQRVSFAPGATAATVMGSVQGYQTRDYILNARAGQRMTIRLDGNTTFLQVGMIPPNGEAVIVGSTWSGILPRNGDYILRVGLVRAEARRGGSGNYTLTVTIR